MSDIIQAITAGITGFTESIPSALKTAITSLLYDTSGSTKTLSDFAKFGFLFMGISMVCGLVYLVVNMIRRKI